MAIGDVQESKRTELWGTFSVQDHLRARAFVTEVLLYDRLVIPRPPTLAEEVPKPGERTQFNRWQSNHWDPDRLRQLLDVLLEHELAIDLPWGEQARDDWKKLYDGAELSGIGTKRAEALEMAKREVEAAKQSMPGQEAYIATGGIISAYVANELRHDTAQRFAGFMTPGVPVEPVISYASYQEFQGEQSAREADQSLAPDTANAYALLGWEFFIPEDTDKSDVELLRMACKLAVRKDLREHRQSFHYWLKLMHEGGIDPKAASADMLNRLQEYRAIIAGSEVKTVARYVAKFAPIYGPLVEAVNYFVGGVPQGLSLAVGLAGAGGPLFVEQYLRQSKPTEAVRPAALVHDITRFFGKK